MKASWSSILLTAIFCAMSIETRLVRHESEAIKRLQSTMTEVSPCNISYLSTRTSRAGMNDRARHAYEIAIGLERDPAVRRYLQQLCAGLTQ